MDQDRPVGVSNGLPHTTFGLPDRAPLGGSWECLVYMAVPDSSRLGDSKRVRHAVFLGYSGVWGFEPGLVQDWERAVNGASG